MKNRTIIILMGAAMFLPAIAMASEQEGGNPWYTLMWNTINFILLVGLIIFAVKKFNLKGMLAERSDEIRDSIADSDSRKADAEQRHEKYISRLNNIEEEVASLRKDFVDAAENENSKSIEEAEAAAVRMRKNAEFIAEQEVKKGRLLLQREAALLAIESAEKLVKDSLNDDDRHRLVTEFLDEVRSS